MVRSTLCGRSTRRWPQRGRPRDPSAVCGCCCSEICTSCRQSCGSRGGDHRNPVLAAPSSSGARLRDGAGTAFIELKRVFRQDDEALLSVLDRIREGDVGEMSWSCSTAESVRRTLAEVIRLCSFSPRQCRRQQLQCCLPGGMPGRPSSYEQALPAISATAPNDGHTRCSKRGQGHPLAHDLTDDGSMAPSAASAARGKQVGSISDGKVYESSPRVEIGVMPRPGRPEDRRGGRGFLQAVSIAAAWALQFHKSQGLTPTGVYRLGRAHLHMGKRTSRSHSAVLAGLAFARSVAASGRTLRSRRHGISRLSALSLSQRPIFRMRQLAFSRDAQFLLHCTRGSAKYDSDLQSPPLSVQSIAH